MPAITAKTIVTNILKTPFLRSLLFGYLAIAIIFPLYGALYQTPLFGDLLAEDYRQHAELAAKHLASMMPPGTGALTKDGITDDVVLKIRGFENDFRLEKLKIYSGSGEVIYSTDPDDIGTENRLDYFHDIASTGTVRSRIIRQEGKSLEGRVVTTDVVETYVPHRYRGTFAGAFEIYMEITDQQAALNRLSERSLMVLSSLAIIIVFSAAIFLYRESHSNMERLQMEDALRESEERYRTILESLDEGYFEADLRGRFTFFNDWIPGALGISREELLGKSYRKHVAPESLQSIAEVFNTILRTGEPAKDLTIEVSPPGRGHRFYELSASLMRDPSGAAVGFRGIARDVTERKQVEETLVSTRNFLQNILNSSIDGIVTTDMRGKITYCSTSFERMTGYGEEELLGEAVRQFYSRGIEDAKLIMDELYEKGELNNYDTRFRKKSGDSIDIMLSASFLRNEKGDRMGTLGIFKNVTEKKEMEQRLLQAEVLEVHSTLAGGIAHEFNNALMGIMGNVELLRLSITEDHELSKNIEPIELASQRMSNLTNQLLAYAEGGRYNPRSVSLRMLMEEALPLVKQDMGPSITLETEFPDDIPNVTADPNQVQMVLSAVLNNAFEAIDGEGVVNLTIRSGEIDDVFVKTDLELGPGHYACIGIEDNGKGMDEETRNRIFDPFFSTKFQGRGLGMAAVFGIINNHGGMISIDSEPDVGTIVRIYLPAVETGAEEKMEAPTQGEPPKIAGPATILVVEDVEMVMDVAAVQTLARRDTAAGADRA